MGRELPPAEVLAAGQRITDWARELKKAGLDGSMDLRARAYLDLLLDKDSRPAQPGTDGTRPDGPGDGGPGPRGSEGPGMPPGTGAAPAGFAGRVNLIVPLVTLLDLAERPGEIPGRGTACPGTLSASRGAQEDGARRPIGLVGRRTLVRAPVSV